MYKIIIIVCVVLMVIVIIIVFINLKNKAAITAPPFFTYIKDEYKENNEVINHEKCHWEQYRRLGFWKFYSQYFKEQFGGYDNSNLEQECYNLINQ